MQGAHTPWGVKGRFLSSVLNKLSIFSDYSQHNMPKGIGSIYYFLKKINGLKHSLQTYNIYFNVLSINITRLAFYQFSWKNHLREVLFVKLDYRMQSIGENSLVTIGKKYSALRSHLRKEMDGMAPNLTFLPPQVGRCNFESWSVRLGQAPSGAVRKTEVQKDKGVVSSLGVIKSKLKCRHSNFRIFPTS